MSGSATLERSGDLVAILTALPAHIGYMMHNGRIFKEGAPHEIEADPEVQQLYLGGGHA